MLRSPNYKLLQKEGAKVEESMNYRVRRKTVSKRGGI